MTNFNLLCQDTLFLSSRDLTRGLRSCRLRPNALLVAESSLSKRFGAGFRWSGRLPDAITSTLSTLFWSLGRIAEFRNK